MAKQTADVTLQARVKGSSAAWIDGHAERLELNRSETTRLMLAFVRANEQAFTRWTKTHELRT